MFNIDKLKRNKDIIQNIIKITNNVTSVTEDCYVVFPTRFLKSNLAKINSEVIVVSYYAIIDSNDNYAVVRAPIMQTLTPSNITDIIYDNMYYKVLKFPANSVMLPNNKCIVRDNFLYYIVDEFILNNYVPFYLDYEDISNLFLEAKVYAGSNIGNDIVSFEVLTAIIARVKTDKTFYYRYLDKPDKSKLTFIGLSNPLYGFDNTGARLIGSYFKDGLLVSIVEEETQSIDTIDILRA